ncbi:SRPBCC family protein [Flavobacterium seoulense]|uniref:Cyclase n=1 Tax=Flavobacterium seoulense TaxID=1492738 RepID=A0A066WNQ4_9FLAO|nr:SRPBCC family protein [Flavobacterium seoulense]KDN55466.1 cyclase [Flavobacterium seoulense]
METRTFSPTQHHNMLGLKTNVSKLERIAMITAGAYLLYKGISKEEKCAGKITSGSAMLLRGVSGYCPVYDAVDHLKNDKTSNVNIRINSLINKPVNEVYGFWRNLENLPRFMNHLESVKTIDSKLSEWTAKGPAGIGKLSWKARIIKDEENQMLSWQSLADSTIENTGKVVFKPIGKTTEIDITISYHAPLGVAGEAAAKFLNPYFEKLIKDDIMNFKTYIESNNYL